MGIFSLFQMAGEVLLDSSEALTGLRNVENAATRTGAVFKKVGGAVSGAGKALTGFVTLPILGAMGAGIKLAADMNETISKTEQVFKKGSKEVINWSDKTLKSIGLAKGTALDMASVYGDMGTAMGLSGEEAQKMAMNLVNLTGDMASFKNMKPDEIHVALMGAYTGETEALKRLGIVMTVANLNEYARQQGIKKTYKEMTESERIMLRYNYIMKASKNSVGDFQRTQDSASNQMRIFTEGIKEAGAKIGVILLPMFTKAVNFLNKLLDRFNNLSPGMKKAAIIMGIVVAAIGPILWVVGGLITSIGTVITVFGALYGVLGAATIPILIIGGLIAGIIATFAAWKLSTTDLKTVLTNAFNTIKDKISSAVKFIKTHIEDIKGAFKGIIKGIKTGDFTNFTAAINNMIPDSAREKVGNIITKIIQFRDKVIEIKDKIIEFATTVKNKATPIINMIVKSIKGMDWKPVVESFNQLKASIIPLIPFLKQLGNIFKITLAVAVGIVIGAFNGIIKIIPTVIATITSIIGVIVSVFGIIRGVFTGDGELVHKSVINLFKNIVNIFKNSFKTVIGFVKGFYEGIVTWFKSLYNKLVGHSIIPDMINGIINWFKKLPGKVIAFVTNLVNTAISKFKTFKSNVITTISSFISTAINKISSFVSNFISKLSGLPGKAVSKFNDLKTKASSIIGGIAKSAYTWGKNLISQFISGIAAKAGALKQSLQNTVAKVKDFLGFSSPTKEGAGKESDKWAPNLMNMFIKGLLNKNPELKKTMSKIAESLNFGTIKNLSMTGVSTGNVGIASSNNRKMEAIQLIINNPKYFNSNDVDKMMSPVISKLQRTLNIKRG